MPDAIERWEYHNTVDGGGGVMNDSGRMGREGWELVSVVQETAADTITGEPYSYNRYHWKRRLIDA